MSSTQLSPRAVDELYQSLITSRQHARQRLQAIAEIERTHRHTPLPELADLAATGALHRAGLDTDPAQQP